MMTKQHQPSLMTDHACGDHATYCSLSRNEANGLNQPRVSFAFARLPGLPSSNLQQNGARGGDADRISVYFELPGDHAVEIGEIEI